MKTDLEIQKDVIEELKCEPILNAAEIGVSVKNGVVSLAGTVDSFFKKISAEKAAKRVRGVRAVAEDILVKTSGIGQRTDAEIAEAILKSLKWNTNVPEDKIKIKVEDGAVELEGEVEWEYQKSAAYNAVTMITGVEGISNYIKITSKSNASPEEIKRKIMVALHRSASVNSKKINVNVIGNTAILTGIVRTWAEKNDAEKATWLNPGIEKVENKLVIEEEMLVF